MNCPIPEDEAFVENGVRVFACGTGRAGYDMGEDSDGMGVTG
jgi:hypothetical protein